MGLDMYLTKKHYVQQWDFQKEEERFYVSVVQNGEQVDFIDHTKVTYVEEQVGYWRKANAIHQWFVDNVQDGEDDCGSYYVSRDKLRELLDTVNRVLEASKLIDSVVTNGETLKDGEWRPNFEAGKQIEDPTVAQEWLPTSSGFFFGGTDYDQWYYQDLEYTKKMLEKALNGPGGNHGDFYYQSSW